MPHADRYLRTSLLVVHIRDDYLLVHPGSSVNLVTDMLGARAAGLLLRGHSEQSVRAWAESRLPGAGKHVSELVDRLETIGAITSEPPHRGLRWRSRSALSLLLGSALTVASVFVPLLPVPVLRLVLDALPHLPLAARNVGQIWPNVDANLRASGYADTSEEWRRSIARYCAAASARTFFYMYLLLVLTSDKLHRLTRSIFDLESYTELERTLRNAGSGVGASLHTSLYVGVIPLLGEAGWECAVLADFEALGVNVGNVSSSGLDLYGRYAKLLNSHSRMAGKALLEHLREGKLAIVAFDAPPQGSMDGAISPRIRLASRQVYRFDGAAWLAARSGKPIVYVSTYQRGRKTVIHVHPPLYADPNMPQRAQVEDLTARLYAAAETFLRQHPEAWMAWCYLHDLVVPDGTLEEHTENGNGVVFAST